MKHINKLPVRIIVAVVIGFLLACGWTDIPYPCPPLEHAGCTAWESAILHPGDLISNKDGSLARATEILHFTSLTSFAVLTIISWVKKVK